jgi:hypothetical protein
MDGPPAPELVWGSQDSRVGLNSNRIGLDAGRRCTGLARPAAIRASPRSRPSIDT